MVTGGAVDSAGDDAVNAIIAISPVRGLAAPFEGWRRPARQFRIVRRCTASITALAGFRSCLKQKELWAGQCT
jgi:hypothetical protein